ncbi:acetylcholine receptor subunit alpha-L1 [Tetranychus urticae]|uniref:acetylcholine receptor subunit alpha-L1 n=1 Tax=Tetranychus urticae TaxID=32264 RepID=UPI00077C0CF9|nr:acetylcholine receptor subunit alpha-L1 [Tetranychus urticae]
MSAPATLHFKFNELCLFKELSKLTSPCSGWKLLLYYLLLSQLSFPEIQGNPDAKRLYDDLMSGYNRIITPRIEPNATVRVSLGLKLTQIIDLNLKQQILTANMWVLQEWFDPKLRWDPAEYGGVTEVYVPAEQIWLPDLVLYNNADGAYAVTIMTKAMIRYNGTVLWSPPAIFKSSCSIDIRYFPFDTQSCKWYFSSWTYDGYTLDLRLIDAINGSNSSVGIDLSEYYLNVEWDVMAVSGLEEVKSYQCCDEPFVGVLFSMTVRRKTLFYTVNLIIPCIAISCLSILVFYLPSDSGEKVSLSIFILLSLTFFLLVLIEIIPTTSLSIPLLGLYLCFTMVLVTCSVVVTIAILNVHFRSPSTHKMAPWVRKFFIRKLPKILLMKPPQYRFENIDESRDKSTSKDQTNSKSKVKKLKAKLASASRSTSARPTSTGDSNGDPMVINELDSSPGAVADRTFDFPIRYPRSIERAITNAMFIAQHIDNADEFESMREDWKYVALVLDRIFLWFFTMACISGTFGIFIQAPSWYDKTQPIDVQRSHIARTYVADFPELSELIQ